MHTIQTLVAQTFQQEGDKIRAAVISRVRDFELAEDALQEAMLVALEHWPEEGVPRNPGAWLTTTARRKALDRLRREQTLASKQAMLQIEQELKGCAQGEESDDMAIPDERLKLMFTCCHPALALDARVALTLHTLGGLSTAEIARAFLLPIPTLAQRLVRGKRKIRDAGIPYRVPPTHLLAERLAGILSVLYLIFNEGYTATSGTQLIRYDLCDEAIRLTRMLKLLLLRERLYEELPETLGLLALMLLQHSRRLARVDAQGELVLLEEQDRSRWNQAEIAEGLSLLDEAISIRKAGPYQIQAAISALHAQASQAEQTDWPQIAALYTCLTYMTPSPVIELNRAVAIAMADGPLRGLTLLDQPAVATALHDYYLYHAARADLLRRIARNEEAAKAYQQALTLCQNDAERTFLQRRLSQLANGTE